MASESLSQNEIDALLGGSVSPTPEPRAPLARIEPGQVQVYDFRRPSRISKDKLRSLEAIYQRFATSLEGWLFPRVRGGVQLQLQSVEQRSFADLRLSLPTPGASYTFDVRDSGDQQGVINIAHELAFFLIDRLFGGSGNPALPNRSLTPIERGAVGVVAERVLLLLQEVWHDCVRLNLGLAGYESIPEMLRVTGLEDPMLVASIEVTAAETRSLLLVCLPFTPLEGFLTAEEVRRASTASSSSERTMSRQMVEHSLRGTRVPVSARLPEFRVSLRELLSLTPGTVLSTGIPHTAPLDVHVGPQRRFLAAPGKVGSSLAVRVTDGLLSAPDSDAIPLPRLNSNS